MYAKKKKGVTRQESRKLTHEQAKKIPTCEWARLIISVSYSKRSSVEFTTQMFDPALSIGELLLEIFYFVMTPSLTFADMQKLIDALYR